MERPGTGGGAAAVYRANPLYELVLLDRVDAGDRALLGELGDDVYGVLRPRAGARLELRAVSPDTALLFLSLSEPAALPEYLRRRLGDDLDRTVGRLVVDGVLEIAHEDGFVSGARAADLLLPERAAGGRGRIGELSRAALRYGQRLTGLPAALVAQRLYLFGRRPLTASLMHRLAVAGDVETHLGIQPGGPAGKALAAGWVETAPSAGERAYWRSWRPRRTRSDARPEGYKLYVSPALEELAPAMDAVAGALVASHGVKAFKVGIDVAGLCRPDKLVVYFDRLDDLREGAARLRERLEGCSAHGVPFTAAITLDGLLSWGADPPVLAPGGAGATSWRLWVSEMLADYLSDARAEDSNDREPWQYALDRLGLAGIDTETWVPRSGMWQQALVSA